VAHASFACHLQDAFVAALNADFGHRARQESLMLDVGTTVGAINYLQRNLRRFCAPSRAAARRHHLQAGLGKGRLSAARRGWHRFALELTCFAGVGTQPARNMRKKGGYIGDLPAPHAPHAGRIAARRLWSAPTLFHGRDRRATAEGTGRCYHCVLAHMVGPELPELGPVLRTPASGLSFFVSVAFADSISSLLRHEQGV